MWRLDNNAPRPKGDKMKAWLGRAVALLVLFAMPVFAQQKLPQGLAEGYDGEWFHVSQQLIDLAEAMPADKFSWRPSQGVRSTSEVYMHIVMANFYFLSLIGQKLPPDFRQGMSITVTAKPEVISWLKRSLEAVKQMHKAETPEDLQRKVHFVDRDTTVDAVYLRAIVHTNEHMGQLVAYARMTGVVPPWSKD